MSSRAQTRRICACCGLLHGVDFAQGNLISVNADFCDDCKEKNLCLLECSGEECTGCASSTKGLKACDACIAACLASRTRAEKSGEGLRIRAVCFVEDGKRDSKLLEDVQTFLTNFDGRGDLILRGAGGMVGAVNRVFALQQLRKKDGDAYKALKAPSKKKGSKWKGWGDAKSHTSATGVQVSARDLVVAKTNNRGQDQTTNRLLVANTRGTAHGTLAELAAKAQADAWATEPHRARTEAETERVEADGWRVEGSEYLGLEVLLPLDDGQGANARIRGWLDAAQSDYVDRSGRAVPLWRAVFQEGPFDGEDQDLELHELEKSLTDAQPSAVADRIADDQRSRRFENVVAARAGSRDARSIAAAPSTAEAAADVLQSNRSVLQARARKSTPDTRARAWNRDSTPVGKRKNGEDMVKGHIESKAKEMGRKRRMTADIRKAERAETGETWRGARARREAERREATTVGIAAARARQKQWKSCEGQGGCGDFYTKVLRCPRCHSIKFKLVSPQPPPPPSDDERNHGSNYTAPPQL